jgi:hypothetical protein
MCPELPGSALLTLVAKPGVLDGGHSRAEASADCAAARWPGGLSSGRLSVLVNLWRGHFSGVGVLSPTVTHVGATCPEDQ